MKSAFNIIKQSGSIIIKQSGSLIKRNYIVLLSFFLPAIILETTYAVCGIFPFGKWDVLIIDLYHQYAPFLSDLREKIRSLSSLLYSWSGGLGTNYLPLFAYYLASPLNLITLLFPKEYLTEAVLVLTLLKVGLAGACFAVYIKSVHREDSLITVAFSLLYALSGYVLVFCWNIMWMDAIYLLPLIVLGLVRLVRDGRGIFFCCALAAAILSNLYMAFFICLFVLLYYPVCLFKYHSPQNVVLLLKKTAQFAGLSLLAAGLASILLVPTFFAFRLTSAAGDKFPQTLTNYFDLFDFITRHFTCAYPSIREGMPNLYSGIVVLILVPVYFLSRSLSLKEKLWHLALLAVLIVSFNMDILNFIWHGFHFPNQIPYRFSFVYTFLVLSMSYGAFNKLREFGGKQIGAVCLVVLGLVIVSQKFEDLSVDHLTVYISVVFIVLYAAALTIDRSYNIRPFLKSLFFVLVVIAEMSTNTALTIYKIDCIESYAGRDGYAAGKEAGQIYRHVSAIKETEGNGFYRMEILPPKTVNDPFLYNYPGLTIFSSTAPVKPVKMFKNLGYHSNGINSYVYKGSTAVLDSLLGIKYIIYRPAAGIEEKLYRETASEDGLRVYENPYALPLGFIAPVGLKNFNSGAGSNPFEVQNNLIEGICGVKDVLVPIDQKQGVHYNLTITGSGTRYYSFKRTDKESNSRARVQFEFDRSGEVYLYYEAPYDVEGSGFVSFNDEKVEFNPRQSSIINLGYCESGTSAELELNFEKESSESGRFELFVYRLNRSAFENAMSLIREKSMTVESFRDTYISGRIEAESTGLMVMSIPYDKDWLVSVDGRKVKIAAVDDCLLSFEVPEGAHKIELRYFPQEFYAGLVITIASVVMLAALIYRNKKSDRKLNDKSNRKLNDGGQAAHHAGFYGVPQGGSDL